MKGWDKTVARHLKDVKKVQISTALELIHLYNDKRNQGMSKEMARKYAIYHMEVVRQGSNWRPPTSKTKHGKRRAWMNPANPHAQVKTFVNIMHLALGAIPREDERGVITWQAVLTTMEKWRYSEYVKIKAAADNYHSIVENGKKAPGPLVWAFLESKSDMEDWYQIKRGKDLFVPGFGTFNIPNAIVIVHDLRMYPPRSAKWRINHSHIFPVMSLRMAGYGINNVQFWYYLRKHEYFRNYAVRFLRWFKEHNNEVDEIVHSLGMVKDNPTLPPGTIVGRLNEQHERVNREWPERNSFKGEFKLMACMPDVDTAEGTLKVIKNTDELDRVSTILSNCASGYKNEIRTGISILVGLYKGDMPIALGELRRFSRVGMEWVWNQRSGWCNNTLTIEQYIAFTSYPTDRIQGYLLEAKTLDLMKSGDLVPLKSQEGR